MTQQGKKYYRIGEVSQLTGVEPHVLRYWESEFSEITPHRVSKQRLYRKEDIDTILIIKNLLHNQRLTIAGAKKQLKQSRKPVSIQPSLFQHEMDTRQLNLLLASIRGELFDILNVLERKP